MMLRAFVDGPPDDGMIQDRFDTKMRLCPRGEAWATEDGRELLCDAAFESGYDAAIIRVRREAMKTDLDLLGFETVSDAITEAIVELLEIDAEVGQAAVDYIEAFLEEDEESSAERKLRKAIAPKIRDALIKHADDWDMPDSADEMVDEFIYKGAFVEFHVAKAVRRTVGLPAPSRRK